MTSLNFALGRHEVILREPFVTSLRSVDQYPVIIYTISEGEHLRGVGECVATPAIVGDSIEGIVSDLKEIITPALSDIKEFEEGIEVLRSISAASSSIAAADIALHSFFANKSGLSLGQFLGSKASVIKSDVTIPIAEPEELERILHDRMTQGFTTFKIKLRAEDLKSNLATMSRISSFAGDGITLRVDPNQAWDFEYSKSFLEGLASAEIDIEYLEQPVGRNQINELAALTALNLAPIMADESLFTLKDLEQLIKVKACSWVNVKLLKSGGIAPAKAIAERALENGIQVSFGSMMEGAGGVMAAALLAAALAPDVVHDLDAPWWHRDSQLHYFGGELAL
jgi:L-alanine-DL-glutamate epimerase-like enolase superfamily enzyme